MMKKLYNFSTILYNPSFLKAPYKRILGKLFILFGFVLLGAFSAEAMTYYSKSTGAPENYSSWGTNSDGTGTAPTNFTTNGDVFVIRTGITMSTDKNWTIGNGSASNMVTLEILGNLSIEKNNTITINSYSQVILNNTSQMTILSQGNGKFSVSSNAIVKTNSPYGISGANCPLPSRDILLSTTANYEFNGTTDQATLGLPISVKKLTISNTSGVVTLKAPLTATMVTIKPGAKLTHTNGLLTVTSFEIQSNATDRGTFVTSGTATVNNTSATVEQYEALGRNLYISSPVTNANASVLGNPGSVSSYNESTGAWVPENNTPLLPMKGYLVPSPAADETVTFSGTLNSGSKSISLTRTANEANEGFNLVGNPYPCYADWDLATKTNLAKSIWYTTQNKNGVYVFDTYGSTSGIGTGLSGNGNVTSKISPMQAFWVRVKDGQSTANLTFDNNVQMHQSITTNAAAQTQAMQKVLRLKVSNGTNQDEAIILFNPSALDGFDDFDSPKMTNNNPGVPEIFTLSGMQPVVINGLSTIYYNTEIPLGFSTGESNSFSIQATEISNFDDGTVVVLKDNETQTETEKVLSVSDSYNFTSDIVSSSNRFSIIFRNNSVATAVNKNADELPVLISKNENNQIVVNCQGSSIDQGVLSAYNVIGKLLAKKQLTGGVCLIDIPKNAGVCLIKVQSGGKSVSRKLVF